MKKLLPRVLGGIILGGIISGILLSPPVNADTGGLASLRGTKALGEESRAVDMKRVPKDREIIERDYLHQPPVIPHQTRGYRIDQNSNKCMSCHSWQEHKQAGATKISMTHFDTRDGQQLSDVSPARYFCTQCHVTQADANPLVDNEFTPVDALAR